ncbi:Glutathione-dependent formaldehyde-activating GFA [Trichophyton interdigitale]|uniref:Glutathione-dependent formaldehyde-activating GFA n=1 Tax=Trichophyton interdigitale TaxID=101480 RepID=A0A9P4YKY1_9EURO|nr:Glutathione-dependent formaldehyde-activating GFA [Trichophyton interdigitale]KAF3898618.1 Glutathione-dependent formaldehyde-activating GFA [Trichophyton interdigitale]KAG8210235.1 Glutathione-dependent formaldehyde-activating GFA [Trichophyton interdigitale]
MSTEARYPLEGGCDCKGVRYQVKTAPLVVHCCHCTWCQRETGSAFAINAMIESDRLVLLKGETETKFVNTPSASGKGQEIVRCTVCRVALWSHYPSAGRLISFVRVGTLDEPSSLPPDIHIFTSTKLKWVVFPPDVPVVETYYEREQIWSKESLARREALQPAVERYQEELVKRSLSQS